MGRHSRRLKKSLNPEKKKRTFRHARKRGGKSIFSGGKGKQKFHVVGSKK